MQYLGHTSLETTQKYLKNVLIEGNGQQMIEEEKIEEIVEQIEPIMKPKRKNPLKLTEEAKIQRLRKTLET